MNAELRDFFTRRSPGTGKAILGLWLACWLTPAFASGLPQGGTITHGQGSISKPSATQMQIDQYSQRMAADFQSFDIARDHGVNISQPGAESLFVGRVTGESATQIFGTLTATGQVMLLNPRGVVFGEGSRVDTASLMATSLNVDIDRVMDGVLELEFSADMAGKIINRGTLTAATGGSVTLLGDEVINEGLIVADLGRVNLASGSRAFVTFDAERLIGVRVTEGALGGTGGEAAVANLGEIQASGGQILLTADAARDLFSMAVNNEGVLRANAAEKVGGEVRLLARGGDTYSSGSIEAVSDSGQGGSIEVLGERVAVTGRIDASGASGGGDIKIGGAFQGQGDTPTASHTYVGPDAQIAADATVAGDGGEVIVWADHTTRFHGDISARGGPEGGDGGFVEVSGKEHLVYRGHTDTRAPQGKIGTLLLDPAEIEIAGGAGPEGEDGELPSIAFADGAGTFTISEAALEAQMADITLEATDRIFTSGTFDNDSDGEGAGVVLLQEDVSLTLRTRNDGDEADTAGGIDLITSAHGADLEFRTRGSGSILLETGATAASPLAAPILPGVLTTAGGNVTLNASGGIGIVSNVSTAGGDITLNANAAGSVSGDFIGIDITGATLDAAGGDLNLTGHGGTATDNQMGIRVHDGGRLETTGAGALTLVGTGGDAGTGNHGIFVHGSGTRLLAEEGGIDLTGSVASGGAGTGIWVRSSSRLTTTGTGAIHLDGTGGAAGSNNVGISVLDSGTQISSVDGDIELVGTGGGTTDFNRGVVVANGQVISTGQGNVLLDGSGGAGINFNTGVTIANSAAQVRSTDGSLTIVGSGGAGSGTDNAGVQIISGAQVGTLGDGDLAITGSGGTGTGDNQGLVVQGAGTTISTTQGAVDIEGTAGASTAAGLLLAADTTLSSTSGGISMATVGAGDIRVAGNLSAGGDLSLNAAGAIITDAGGFTSSGLSISMVADDFVELNADLTATADGDIFLHGQGLGAGNYAGVSINDVAVTSVGGDITFIGNGGDTGSTNYGVYLRGAGTEVTTTGAGAITLDGTGGTGTAPNIGLAIVDDALVQVEDGTLSLIGAGGTGDSDGIALALSGQDGARVIATGAGDIDLAGTSSGGVSALIMRQGSRIESGTGDIHITLNAGDVGQGNGLFNVDAAIIDGGTGGTTTLDISNAFNQTVDVSTGFSITGAAPLLVRPIETTGNLVIAGVAANGDGNFFLSDNFLAGIAPDVAEVTIGRGDGEHAVDIRSVTFANPVTVQAPAAGGNITIGAGQTLAGTGAASIDLVSADPLALAGSITTEGQALRIGSGTVATDLVVAGDVLIDTTTGGAVAGGDVTVFGATDGDSAGAGDLLTLLAGTGGTVSFIGDIGDAATDTLNALTVTAGTVNLPATSVDAGSLLITADAINLTGTSYLTSTSGAISLGNATGDALITLSGDTDIQSAGSAGDDINLDSVDGTVADRFDLSIDAGADGVATIGELLNIGNLGLVADAVALGSSSVEGALTLNVDAITLTGGAYESGAAVTFNGAVELAGGDVTVTSGGMGGHGITFTGSVQSNVGEYFGLNLIAGAGDVAFDAAVGGGAGDNFELGFLQITSAADVDLEAVRLSAAGGGSGALTQVAGTGTTTLQGAISAESVSLNAQSIHQQFGAPITTAGNSIVMTSTGPMLIEDDLVAMGGGDITLTATGTDAGNYSGIVIDGTDAGGITLGTTGSGAITLNGTGGDDGSFNLGVAVTDANIESVDGFIAITGTSRGDVTGDANIGVGMEGPVTIAASGSGSIALTGVGGDGAADNIGIELLGPDISLNTVSGSITLTGTGGGLGLSEGINLEDGVTVAASGGGAMTLTGAGATNSPGISTSTAGDLNVIGDASAASAITLEAGNAAGTGDTIQLSGVTVQGTGNLLLQPTSGSTAIGLGDAAGVSDGFILDAAELGNLADGFASITIGQEAGEHAISVGDDTVFTDPVIIRTGTAGGAITLNGTLTGNDNATIDLLSMAPLVLAGTVETEGNVIRIGDGTAYAGQMLIDGAARLDSDLAISGGADITVFGEIDGFNPGGNDVLTLHAPGAVVSLEGDVEGEAGMLSVVGGEDLQGLLLTAAAEANVRNVAVQGGNIAISATDINLFGDTFEAHGSGAISFNGAVVLNDATFFTTAGGLDDDITVTGTLNSVATAGHGLTLNSGADGDIVFMGPGHIGNLADGELDHLHIDAARNVTFDGSVTLLNALTQVGGTGTTTFNGAVMADSVSVETRIVEVLAGGITTAGNTVTLIADNFVQVAAPIAADGGGDIFLHGQGLGAGNYAGVSINDIAVTSDGGDITLIGQGGDSGSDNRGVSIVGADARLQTTAGGEISVTGTGGAGNGAAGVVLLDGSLTAATGDVQVTGTGGTAGERNRGIRMVGAGIETTAGDISLTGTAGSGPGDSLTGVLLSDTGIETATGNIAVTGTAATAAGDETSGHHGVRIVDASRLEVSAEGDISITGTGGDAALGSINASHGIIVLDSDVLVEEGDLTLSGTALAQSPAFSESFGIVLFESDVFTRDGDLALNATAVNAAGLITNSLDSTAPGTGETNIGFADNTGAVSLNIANNMTTDSLIFLGTTRVRGAGDLTIAPSGATTTIGVGAGATGNLNLNQDEVAAIRDGFNSITIGRASGEDSIRIGTANFLDPTTFHTAGSATLRVVAGQTLLGGGAQDMDGTGHLTLESEAPIELRGNIQTHGTNLTLDGPLLVAGGRTLNTALSGSGGDVTITGAVDGQNAGGSDGLTILAGAGTATLAGDVEGDAGAINVTGGQDLQSLTVNAAAVSLQDVQLLNGNLTITSDDVTLNGDIYRTVASGNITFNGNLILGDDLSLTADDGTVTFTGTLNSDGVSARSLLVDATTASFGGAVGGSAALASLEVTGATQIDGGLIRTDGDQDYAAGVTLGANTNLRTLAGGSIDIGGPVSGGGSAALDVVTDGSGSVSFGGSVGGSAATDLTALDVTAASIALATGVDLSTAANDGDITFATNALTLGGGNEIDAGAGTFRISGLNAAGSIEFAPSNSMVADAYIDSGFSGVNAGSFVVGGAGQIGDILLGNAADGVIADYSLNVQTDGGIVFRNDYGAVGPWDLTLAAGAAGIEFGSSATAPLQIALIDGGSFLAQGDVRLTETTEIDAGDITFLGAIDGATGAEGLTVVAGPGSIEVQGDVGGSQALAHFLAAGPEVQLANVAAGSITVNAGLISLNGATYLAQSGGIALSGDVVLTTDSTLDSSAANGDILVTGSIDSDDDANRRSLDLVAGTGAVDLQGAVGAGAALNAFSVSSAGVAELALLRANSLSVTADDIILNGASYTALTGDLSLDGDVTLAADATLDSSSGGELLVTGTIDSDGTPRDLTLLAGGSLVDLQGDVGGDAALQNFELTTTGSANLAAVTADSIQANATQLNLAGNLSSLAGGISLDANLRLLETLVFDSSAADGDIDVSGSIDGAAADTQGLTLLAGGGAVDLAGAVGGSDALTGFVISSAASADLASVSAETIDVTATAINLNGGSYLATAGATFTGSTTLNTAVSVDAGTGADGITFDGTVDGAQALTLAAGDGDVRFTGVVGGSTALGAVTFNAVHDLTADAAFTAASVNQAVAGSGSTFFGGLLTANTGPVSLHADAVTLDDGARSFGQAVTLTAIDGDVAVSGSGITTTAAANSGVTSGAIVINVLGTGGVDVSAPLTATGATNDAGSGSGGGVIDISSTGGGIRIAAGPVSSDGGAAVGGNNAGGAAGNISLGGGPITLDGSSFTAAGGAGSGVGSQGAGANISFDSDVLLATGPTAMTTGTTGGSISFNAALDGGQDLSLSAGTGNISFVGTVGSDRLGALEIVSASDVTANALSAASISQLVGSGTTTFDGAVDTDAAAGISLLGNDVVLNAGMQTLGGGGVTTDLGGALTMAAAGDIESSGPVSLTAAGGISTAGDVLTDGSDIDFLSATSLTGAVAIGTGLGGGDISFASTVDGAQDLTLAAGSGNIDFTAAVGGTSRLGALEIVSAGDVTANAVTAASLSQLAGTGITTLNGMVDTNTAAGVSLTGFDLAVNAGIRSSQGGGVAFAMDNAITIASAGDIDAAGPVSLSAAAGITTAGDITTAGADVDFLSATTLSSNAVAISTGSGGGNISFADTLDGGQNLGLTAGDGNIEFMAAVGGTTRLGALQIVSANDVSANAMTLASLSQLDGSGVTSLNGLLDTNAAAGINLAGFDLAVNAGITTSNGGGVSANMAGVITIDGAGNIDASGPVSLSAGGGITTAGDIVTDEADVTFASATTLADAVSIDTGAGAGDITFAASLDGGNDLTLTAGDGDISLAGTVGGTDALGTLEIVSANDVSANAMTLGSLRQLAGSGVTSLDGQVHAAGDVSLTGTRLTVNQAVTTTAGGDVTVAISDTASFASSGDVTADGAVSLTAANGIDTAGDISSSGGDVDFLSATTLTGAVAIVSAGGDVSFASSLDGNHSLRLDAGSGDITFSGLLGDQSRLGAVTIDDAGDVTVNGIRAASLNQVAGTGTTTFNGGSFSDGVPEAVNLTGAANVDSNAINLQQRLTAGSSVDLSAAAAMTLAAAGDIVAGGGVTLTADGGITTAGDVDSSGGAITFASPSTLSGAVTLASNGGDVTLAPMTGAGQDLTINAGAGSLSLASLSAGGSVEFAGAGTASIGDLAAEAVTVTAGGGYGFDGTVTVADALTLDDLGTATFSGNVAAGSLATNAAGSTVIFDGAIDVAGALAINDGSQVTFNGSLLAGSMSSAATATGIAFNDSVDVSGSTSLANTGMTVFGSDGDMQTFAGGLQAAGPITTFATLRTDGQAMTLGSVTQAGDTVMDTTNDGASTAGAALTVGAVDSAGFDLALQAGAGGSLNLTSIAAGGTVAFRSADQATVSGALQAETVSLGAANAYTVSGALDLGSLDTSAAGDASITLTGGGQVRDATVFEQTGDLNLGDTASDRFVFAGGLDTTATMLNLHGVAATDSAAIAVGDLTLVGNGQLDSTNAGDPLQDGAAITVGAVTGATGSEVLELLAGVGDVTVSGGISDLASFFVRSSNSLNLSTVQTNGNSIRTLSAGDVSLNGNLTAAQGDVSIISTGGSVTQGDGTTIEATTGNVHLVGFNEIGVYDVRAPSTGGSILLALLDTSAGGVVRRQADPFRTEPDLQAGNLIAVVSSAEADFGLSDDGFRLQGQQQFFGMSGGSVFIRQSNAATVTSLPIAQQNAFISVLEQTAAGRAQELPIDAGLLFAARNALGQAATTLRLDRDALREFQAQTQQSDEEEVLTDLGEEVFLDIALFDFDRERPLCLPENLQGPDAAPCSGQAVAAFFDRLAEELMAAAARGSAALDMARRDRSTEAAGLSAGGQ